MWSCQWRLGEIDGDRPDQSGVVVNLGFRGGPHYEVIELWEGAASHPSVTATLEKLGVPVFVFGFEAKGRWGGRFRGQEVLTNNSSHGHGEPGSRISLPVLSFSRQPEKSVPAPNE
jgi:hypothetical protein